MRGSIDRFGHAIAFVTILIWGTTFISTKVLLTDFTPIEILFIRFLMGYGVLWVVYPHKRSGSDRVQEFYFAASGLCGVTLYYLLENISLTYTSTSNAGIIISSAPFFTAIFNSLFMKKRSINRRFVLGFMFAILGIYLITLKQESSVPLSFFGDMLALAAAALWGGYGVLTKKISNFGYHAIETTRRTFFYGLLFMIPVLFVMGFEVQVIQITEWKNLFNFLFLGLGASALCFVTWNMAVKALGAVKTSVYIYMVPVITTITSAVILDEKIRGTTIAGIFLTLLGLLISEQKKFSF